MNERILKNLVNGNTIVVVSDSNKINLVTYADFCFFVERKRIYKFEYVNRELIFPNGGKVIFVEKQRIDNIKGLEIQDYIYQGDSFKIEELLRTRIRPKKNE